MQQFPAVRLILLAFILLAICSTPIAAWAQIDAAVRITALISSDFPSLSIYFSVSDSQGQVIAGLPADSFRVVEDGIQLPDLVLEEVQPGIRQIIVINTSTGLSRRDESGTLYYEYVRRAMLELWQSADFTPYGVDDLTLITTDGALVSHAQSAAAVASALDMAQPTFDETLSDIDLLLHGLTVATDPSPEPGMPRHLIFLTPVIPSPTGLAVTNAIAHALESGTAIHVVLVGAEAAAQSQIDPLRLLALETGGGFYVLDPEEGLNDLAAKLIQQRQLYRLTVDSLVYRSGEHTIEVQVSGEALEGYSQSLAYRINIEPPEVAFVDPPTTISRQPSDPDQPLETLSPSSQDLALLVTFPDGHTRSLVESWLVANGEVVARNTAPPFEALTWDLSQYYAEKPVTLQAGVQDSLGLEGVSVQLLVHVEVPQPPQGLSALRPALTWLLAALGVLIVGVFLAVALISTGRQRVVVKRPAKQATSPVEVRLRQAVYPRRPIHQIAQAFLIPLGPQGQEGQPIAVTGAALTLGRNASLVSAPIDDPSIAPLHARLIRRAGGEHVIRDQGSVAGTWVNHQLVPDEGQALKHGDLIHLGRIAFRFRMRVPPAEPQVRITPTDKQGTPLDEEDQASKP